MLTYKLMYVIVKKQKTYQVWRRIAHINIYINYNDLTVLPHWNHGG